MFKIIGILIPLLIVAGIGSLIWYIFMKTRYKTVASNEAMIITGPKVGDPEKEKNVYKDDEGRHMRIIRGGGYRMKMFQSSNKVSLKSFQLNIETPQVYTEGGLGVKAQAIATVKVANDLNGIVKYAEQFLGKDQKEISSEIENVLNTNLRSILSKMTVEQINSDREGFNNQVTEVAQKQLNNMGFVITSLGLSNIEDDEGYLENLGKPQIAKVQKEADIAESNAKRETELKVAENDEIANKEKIRREMSVAEERRKKDLRDQEILSETNKATAQAEAAGQLERESRQLEIRQKQLEVDKSERQNELDLIQMEKQNDVKIQKEKDEVRRQQAETDKLVALKQAEADYETKLKRGQAEAEVIREKYKAEAKGLKERAQAISENKEAILAEKFINMLPELAKAIAEPMSNVESIRVLDGGNGDGINSLSNNVISQMSNLEEGFGQMTGLNLTEMLKNVSQRKQTINVENNEQVKNNQSTESENKYNNQDIDDNQVIDNNQSIDDLKVD